MTHAERHERREAVVSSLRAGQEEADVAAQFGLCEKYVRLIGLFTGALKLKATKLHNKRSRKRGHTVAALAALLNTDDSQSEIACKLNVTRQRVNQIMLEATAAGIVIPGRNGKQT